MHIIIYVYDFVLFDNGLAWIPFMTYKDFH